MFLFKTHLLFFVLLFLLHFGEVFGKGNSLNPNLQFKGNYILYQAEKIHLGPKAYYIDGQLTDEVVAKYSYVYNSINDAVKTLHDGTEDAPMVLYIAPYVYWLDNPDDPAIRIPKVGNIPFGLEIKCEWLQFYGLSSDARDVVLACNRGQTMGAKGNFTMLKISGQGTRSENITFGNYCNIDLDYPLKPELNRKKRGSAIVQAQLIFCDGDKIFARNTHFVSRLNLCPFVGGKRTLFDRCHFESTDDALNGRAVYLNSTLDFYSGKPFWGTFGTGAVFLNCDVNMLTRGSQYFTKSKGQLAVIDTRFTSSTARYIGWRAIPDKESRNYQYKLEFNETPLTIGTQHPFATVDLTDKDLLDAYRIEYDGKIIYNTYNLLRGEDDWDPMGIKESVFEAEKEHSKSFTNIATQLLISPTQKTIETGKEKISLNAQLNKFGNFELKGEKVEWKLAPEYKSLAYLNPQENGSCELIPTNTTNNTKEVIVQASTSSGLEAASLIYITPEILEAPKFKLQPIIEVHPNDSLSLKYSLDTSFEDQSLVRWFRCKDVHGSDPIEIMVSRFNKPNRKYEFSAGDVTYYIMASVEPKHLKSKSGTAVKAIMKRAVTLNDVKSNKRLMKVDLEHMSTKYHAKIRPGFWTLDCFAPADTHEYNWTADTGNDSWYYGLGINGAANDTGLVQATKGARIRYTPVGEKFGDVKISFTAVPAKTAGQGFSSARAQYMDVFIKFDTKTLTGYALRFIRTTKYHNALDCVFMQYKNGNAVAITEPVSTDCYRPNCIITLEVRGNKLRAHAETPSNYYIEDNRPEVVQVLDMETEILSNIYGGFGFQHTGTVRSGATLIKDLTLEWME